MPIRHPHYLRGRFCGFKYSLRAAFNSLEAEAAYRHLHIGLAGADPYFTKSDVIHGEFFLTALHGNGVRAAGLGGSYPHFPGTVLGHLCLECPAVPGCLDGNGITGLSPAPYGSRGLTLHNCVVTEDIGQHKGRQEKKRFLVEVATCMRVSEEA